MIRLNRWHVLASALAAALVFWCYAPALSHRYVWDDILLFFENGALRQGWASMSSVFAPVLSGTTYLRPLVLSTFVVEFSLGGPSELVSHGVNIAFHLANVVLMFALAMRFWSRAADAQLSGELNARRIVGAALVALLYGLHPALAEAVAWVAGRFDLMMTFFALSAVLAALSDRKFLSSVGAALFAFCAMLCKEMAITLPVVIPFLLLARDLTSRPVQFAEWFRNRKAVVILLWSSALAYLCLRFVLVPGFVHAQPLEGNAGDWLGRLVLVARSLLFYMRMIVYPFDQLEPSHALRHESLTVLSVENIAAVSLLIATPLVIAFAVIRRDKLLAPALVFAAFCVSLTPVLNFIPLALSGDIGANRFLTFPLALFLTMVVVLLTLTQIMSTTAGTQPSRGVAAMAGLLAALVIVGQTTFLRPAVRIWSSDLSLFASTYERHPDNANIGVLYLAALNNYALRDPRALPALDAGIQRLMNIPDLQRRLSEQELGIPVVISVLMTLGQTEAARWYMDQLPNMRSPDARMQVLLAKVQLLQKERKAAEAKSALEEARQEFQRLPDTRRGSFLYSAEAHQALLEGNATELRSALTRLQRGSSPGHHAEALSQLQTFRQSLCEADAKASAATTCSRPEIGG